MDEDEKGRDASPAFPEQIVVGKQQQMEKETLLEGLHNILDDYRDGSQILREMVQNAEDAGASCFKICYDKRSIDPGKSLNISHYFKGPGLCIYNDATFKENDWKGIKKIGASWKRNEKEKMKIGRFGQGFKSVFHITDYVIVLSGKELLIIDPLKSEDKEKECLSVTLKSLAKLERGRLVETLRIFQNKFSFDITLLLDKDPSYEGTLFWLGFRTHESPLSQMIYTEEKVNLLLQQFGREMPLIPLFLTHMKLIEIVKIDDRASGDGNLLHRVSKTERDGVEINPAVCEVEATKKLPNETTMSINKITVRKVETVSGNAYEENIDWTIASCVFGLSDMSEKMKLLSGIDTLSFTPMTNIAYCTKSSTESDLSGHIFCFLPLPLSPKTLTGLPVHLNGFFALEHNRCYVKYKSDQDQQNSALEWNLGLIQELFPRNYHFLLNRVREDCITGHDIHEMVNNFYGLVPDPDKVDINWHPMLKELYTQLFSEPVFYTDQNKGRWVNMKDASMEVYKGIAPVDTERSVIQKFILKCGKNLVILPEHFKNIFCFMNFSVETITPALIRREMREQECWKQFSHEEKLSLLDYILSDKNIIDLQGLKLLPLSDGSFTTFTVGSIGDVYETKYLLTSDDELKLFPGLESKFVCRQTISEPTWALIRTIAEEGQYQLKKLSNDEIPVILKDVFNTGSHEIEGQFKPKNEVLESKRWIENLWKFIIARQFEDLSPFEDVPMIPIITSSRFIGNEKVEAYWNLKGDYMFSSYRRLNPISEALQRILSNTGLCIINPGDTISVLLNEVVDNYIMLPTPENVIHRFAAVSNRSDCARRINENCSDEDRYTLAKYLQEHLTKLKSDSKDFFKLLHLFYQTDHLNTMTSINQNPYMVTIPYFPDKFAYPRTFVQNKHRELFIRLGGEEMNENQIYILTLDHMLQGHHMYDQFDKQKFMVFLKNHRGLKEAVLTRARKLKFIPTERDCYCNAMELFDPCSKLLQDIFVGEQGRFPNMKFIRENDFIPFLKDLGLKTEQMLTSSTMIEVVERLNKLSLNDNQKLKKARALLKIVIEKDDIFSEQDLLRIQEIKWIPFLKAKPSDYFPSLEFYGENQSATVCTPMEIKSSQYLNLVGSIKPLIDNIPRENKIAVVYKWFEEPDIADVIQHFKNITKVYTGSQNSRFVSLSGDIYQHLNRRFQDGEDITRQTITKQLRQMHCIPTSQHGFKAASKTTLSLKCSADAISFSLEPYMFTVADEFKYCENLFLDIGVHGEVSFDILESVLSTMNKKYSKSSTGSSKEKRRDRKLAVDILKMIAQMGVNRERLLKIYVPIRTIDEQLVFDQVSNCTYTDQRLVSVVESDIIFSHSDINEIASQLGIATVTTRALKKNSVFIPWGQTEPLTTAIADLLEGYADGFSIPKELFQNADDAGATKIAFIYDERQNYGYRCGLFDKGMAECHGQALWVYNDAIFSEKDFDSILKLGGRTKLHDKEKIGKFGLGFCSVYNLTDVPSFISGNTMVVLDPHLHHLGDAIQEGNPGVRVAITKDILEIYQNQFKPFDGILGVNFSDTISGKKDFEYNATLFRLPLRTQCQSTKSRLRNTEYRKDDMILLIDKLMTDASNLLLFSQSVKEIHVYHIESACTNPEKDVRLTFRALKAVHGLTQESFLRTVVRCEEYKQMSECQLIDIKIETTKDASRLLKERVPTSDEQSFLLSWNTGKKSFDLAKKLKQNRAIPIGSVAIPVDRHGEKIVSLIDISKVPTGFYDESHMFCFLPLPSPIQLPVHVNGCFMVERDRKNIVTYNEDDISHVNCEWNNTMLTDIIQNAYVDMFSYVISNLSSLNRLDPYWTMWPFSGQNIDINKLVSSFYDYIVSHDKQIFFRVDMQTKELICTSFKNAVFLDPIFRTQSENGDIAFNCLTKFYERSKMIVMDMPENVYDMIQGSVHKTKRVVEGQFISKFEFFKNFFLPFLMNDYWITENSVKNRDELLKMGIEDGDLQDLMKTVECIPVKNSDLLRKPSDLVYQSGSVSEMFDIDDHRFPKEDFERLNDTLNHMGMMDTTVPSCILFERAYSMRELASVDSDRAVQRYRAILKYLRHQLDEHTDLLKMRSIPFIPIMERPNDWPEAVPWKGQDEHGRLKTPEDLFLPQCVDLSGAVRFIAGNSDSVDARLLRLIGVQDVQSKDVVDQLIQLGKSTNRECKRFKMILKSVYSYLDTQLNNEETDSSLKSSKHILQENNVVYINGVMIKPENTAMSLEGNCSPYLYQIDHSMREFDNLWSFLGISEYFDLSVMTKILQQQKDKIENEPLNTDEIKCVVDILWNICKHIKRKNRELTGTEKDQIYLPDSNGILREINEVCFDDGYMGIVSNKDDFHYIHKQVSSELGMIETLQIPSKRRLHLTKYANVLPFGQKEKLVNRLKGIISAYPRDHSVMNELLQNADDAGASEIHFVYDMRKHNTEHIFSESWSQFQGPALTVFNNAWFSDDDLKKIQDLGVGSKHDDPLKTGQFGIGFNAVYHLTDVPSFITKGPNRETFCVFDPHCSNAPSVDEDSPGFQFDNLEELKRCYLDVYCAHLQTELPSKFGTWFRFPLRTHEQAKKSHISDSFLEEKAVNEILKIMKKNMKKSLLFLTNVKKISLSYIKPNTKTLSDTHTVSIKMSDKNKSKKMHFKEECGDEMRAVKQGHKYLSEIKFLEIVYDATINVEKKSSDRWLIVEAFGFPITENVSRQIDNAFRDEEIMLSPIGGSAKHLESFNLETNKVERMNEHCDTNAFCFLPLPISTGFPIHVNGHFALSQNRTHIFGGNFRNDIRYIWNSLLVTETIAHTYSSLIQAYKDEVKNGRKWNELLDFFKAFPRTSVAKEDIWKDLSFATFNSILTRRLTVFPVCPAYMKHECTEHTIQEKSSHRENFIIRRWVSLQTENEAFPAYFDDIKSFYEIKMPHNYTSAQRSVPSWSSTSFAPCTFQPEHELREVLIEIGMKVVCCPKSIFESMESSCRNKVHSIGKSISKSSSKTVFGEITANDGDLKPLGCICPRLINPKDVIAFLQTWNRTGSMECVIGNISSLKNTKFKTIDRLVHVLKFCMRECVDTIKPIIDLPLLVDGDLSIKTFRQNNDLILTGYSDLLPGSPEKFVHIDQVSCLKKFEKHFRVLDLSVLTTLLPKSLSLSKYHNNGPIDMCLNQHILERIWTFLNTQDQISEEFKKWCLLPCKWNGKDKLVSMQQAYCLFIPTDEPASYLDVSAFRNEYISKLELPSPILKITGMKHVCEVVASLERPEKLVDFLYYHRQQINWAKLETCQDLLQMFAEAVNCLDQPNFEKIKCLNIFKTVTGNIVAINGCKQVLVVKNSDCSVVSEGIDDICSVLGATLLEYNQVHERLFAKLGCISCYETKKKKKKGYRNPLALLYTRFIIPNFNLLKRKNQIPHLEFIRDELLKDEEIQKLLRNLKFVPHEDGGLRYAKNFFSPRVELFAELCMQNETPPEPFSKSEWDQFMEYAGIETEITEDMILRFAHDIQRNGAHEKSEKHSKLLLENMYKLSLLKKRVKFLTKIGQIHFITALTIDKDYIQICDAFNPNGLVSFQSAENPQNAPLCWSMNAILPNYAIPKDDKDTRKMLQISEKPEMKSVISHIHKVCNNLNSPSFDENRETKRKFVKDLMQEFYAYLDELREDRAFCSEARVIFGQTPLIYNAESRHFHLPSCVVLNLPKELEIPSYLSSCSECYGAYFDLFRILGASDGISLINYFQIMKNLKQKAKGKKLTVTELCVFELAFKSLLQSISTSKDELIRETDGMDLYLLNEKSVMKLARDLVASDNFYYKSRIGKTGEIDFLCDLRPLMGDHPNIYSLLLQLPVTNRPTLLSDCITEDVLLKDSEVSCDLANQVESYLTDDNCRFTVLRLLKTYQEKYNVKISERDYEQILEKLRILRVIALPNLETTLLLKNQSMENCIRKRIVFFVKKDNIFYIQYYKSSSNNWIYKNAIWFARGIQELTGHLIDSDIFSSVLPHFRQTREEIGQMLDGYGLVNADYVFNETSWFPLPGTPVSDECMDLLASDFTAFKPGDHAVCEMYGIERDIDGEDTSVYIYVKILEQLTEDAFPVYLVNTGEEPRQEVPSYRLYKLIRREENTSTDLDVFTDGQASRVSGMYEEVFQTVEEILVDSWREGAIVFKRVVRRLVLRWHPDKNDNSNYCSTVFTHLTQFIKKLQDGEIDVSKIDAHREPGRDVWNEYIRKATGKGEVVEGFQFDVDKYTPHLGRKLRSRSTGHSYSRAMPNPQPQMGRVWMKQAKFDVEAARLSLQTACQQTYNWVCVQSHQAAEKALKAVLVTEDMSKIGNDHFLPAAVAMRNPFLQVAVHKLESLVINYSRMRYPRLTSYPSAPSELYTKEQAEESVLLATEIVELVDDNLM